MLVVAHIFTYTHKEGALKQTLVRVFIVILVFVV
jgi:hypothetical protein